MKIRFLALLLAAVSVLCLVGCTAGAALPDTEDEVCVYSAQWFGRLIRYDLVNKKASVVCPEPACEHKDCPASSVDKYYVGNEHIVLMKNNGYSSAVYCYYINKGEFVKIMECAHTQLPIIGGSCTYFSAAYIEYAEGHKPLGRRWHVYKYDMENGELTTLTQEPLTVAEGPRPRKINEASILWEDENGYYTTDLQYRNAQSADYNSGMLGDYEYIFEKVRCEDSVYRFNISAKNRVTGEVRDVLKGAHSYRLDFYDDPKGAVFTEYTIGEPVTELHYVSFDTLERKKLCTVPEGYSIMQVFTADNERRYIGDYVGVYIKSLDNKSNHSEKMMFVNVKTGESFIIS